MSNDPKFIRLCDRLSGGMRADLDSGFSIAGLDVQRMPDPAVRPMAYNYIKGELRSGTLEGASQSEFDEAHPDGEVEFDPTQETHVQARAHEQRAKLLSARGGHEDGSWSAEEARLRKIIKAQGGDPDAEVADDEDDDETFDIDTANVDVLKEQLAARSLDTSGNKAALKERLQEALDAEEE